MPATFADQPEFIDISGNFEYIFVDEAFEDSTIEEIMLVDDEEWVNFSSINSYSDEIEQNNVIWFRAQIYNNSKEPLGIYIKDFVANSMQLYLGQELKQDFSRSWIHNHNNFVQLLNSQNNHEIYIKAKIRAKVVGPSKEIFMGDYHALNQSFLNNNLENIYIGFIIMILSFVILFSTITNFNKYGRSGIALSFTTLSISIVLIVTYPVVLTYYHSIGQHIIFLYDISLYLLLTSMIYFVINIFSELRNKVLVYINKFMIVTTFIYIIFLLVNNLNNFFMLNAYLFFSMKFIGVLIILTLTVLMISLLTLNSKNNIKLRIFKYSFFGFLLTVIYEISKYFSESTLYMPDLWKYALILYILSLLVIMGLSHTYIKKENKELT